MQERDQSIDILRGFAIFTMIAANMAAHSLVEPHSFFFRLYGSFAAPMFIFLAGMMVSFTSLSKLRNFGYYLKRSITILLIAACMDFFLWKVLPFSTFDVLYVIALSLPLIYFFNKLRVGFRLTLVLVILLVTPLLQYHFGYQPYPLEIYYDDPASIAQLSELNISKQLFIDGWFPIFPWLGISFFGAFIGTLKIKLAEKQLNQILRIVGFGLVLIGSIIWYLQSPILLTRAGYSELFYPPTLGYLFSFLGAILLLLSVSSRFEELKALWFLKVLGKSSLLNYVMHTIIIVFVFNQFDSFSTIPFLGLYLLHTLVLIGLCTLTQKITKGKKLPFLLRIILGG